jgi:hypothetical protein
MKYGWLYIMVVLLGCKQKNTGPSYTVETIQMPPGLTSETGAIEFLPNGKLVACFTRGEVMIYDPAKKSWSLFAEGLHDALGILVVSNSELLIMQRPELTRVKDTDGDGQADVYENVTDAFGISGNYHEFNYGPVRDSAGNLFIALNASSAGGGMRDEVRGRINLDGRDGNGNGQMYSAVPYRGWVMRLTKDSLLPYACGFRSPNGIGFDAAGNLFVTDNQGDWIGTSALHHVREGKFYGHPASLVWKQGWHMGNPFKLPVQTLDSMRTRAAVLFPHNLIANSPSEPVWDLTNGKFGPFKNQLFVGEMNEGRIVRVMLEKVGGEFQGACMPFIDGKGLRKGNNRLAFAPDGSLWVGQNSHGWLGDEGIQRIVFHGGMPFDIYNMHLTKKGFDLSFTEPVDVKDTAQFRFSRYYYLYHKKYGSDQIDHQPVPVTDMSMSKDGKTVSLSLAELKPGYIYELKLGNILSKKGKPLQNKIICYTLNRL